MEAIRDCESLIGAAARAFYTDECVAVLDALLVAPHAGLLVLDARAVRVHVVEAGGGPVRGGVVPDVGGTDPRIQMETELLGSGLVKQAAPAKIFEEGVHRRIGIRRRRRSEGLDLHRFPKGPHCSPVRLR